MIGIVGRALKASLLTQFVLMLEFVVCFYCCRRPGR